MNNNSIKKIGITDLYTDAIVNAANERLMAGGGVCGAIFKAAGHSKLQATCNAIGHCDTGSAVITPGFDLKAKYIIHAVGPVWDGGSRKEPQMLYGAYRRSLELAVENACHSIGFPLISAGIFGYPKDQAWRKAIQACSDFFDKNPNADLSVVFAVLDHQILDLGIETLEEIAPQYMIAAKNSWKTSAMPESHETFILKRPFSDKQMQTLRMGHIPQEMEDKWFWYMEGDCLFAHRSWTGFCVYIIEFSPDGNHRVTVNRNPEQYGCTSIDEDIVTLNKLLDWWTGEPYDYYNEWLAETVDAIKKAESSKDKLKVGNIVTDAVFFHNPTEPDGYLSNWFLSVFTVDGVKYSSMEQYIMYQKCILFGDKSSAEAVLATDDPKAQQEIGRQASGYVNSVWAGRRQLIAVHGLLAKFSQNEELKKKLLDTGDAWIVECAHGDTIWACGITLKDDSRFDASKWRGNNILGFALMEVREVLKR